MKNTLVRALADHGILLVLLLLCLFFSVVTYSEQSPTGAKAFRGVAEAVFERAGERAGVLIVASNQPSDSGFAEGVEREMVRRGMSVLGVVRGEPKDARDALVRVSSEGARLDAIACTQSAGAWRVFSDLGSDFPALGAPIVILPQSYGWPNFLKAENLLNISNQIAVIAIMAIGMTLVIISGGIDLSVGSLLALSAVLVSWFIRDFAGGVNATIFGMLWASIMAIFICGVAGAFSGFLITRFAIPPFIVTLAMMLVASGIAFTLAEGQSIFQIPDSFVWLGRGADLMKLPNAVVLMIFLYVLAHVLMSRMKMGRYLYAVGGNDEAARISGLPVKRVLMFAYISSASLAGLGGVVMASQLKSGSATYGNMYELYVIAAVVVGGASLSGGVGKMMGTLIGAFTIAVIQNGMNLTNVESYTQKVVLGVVILGAVMLDKFRRQK